MPKKFIDELIAEANREITEEEKIIDFYSCLQGLKMDKKFLLSCAYFGKSIINKLVFVLAFFRQYGLKEYDGKKVDYIILDGKNITDDYESFVKAFRDTKDIPFVIFTQSEFVLTNDDNILLVKYMNEHDRHYNPGSKVESFNVSSQYIFLSDYDCFENVSAERKHLFYSIVNTVF
jgi:hypothetical protein